MTSGFCLRTTLGFWNSLNRTMLISYAWLHDYTDTKLTPQELRERLTMVGLAIDAVEEHDSDSVLDVEVPSNRPDCLSHVGIAREVAVIEKKEVHLPQVKAFKTEGRASGTNLSRNKGRGSLPALRCASRARGEDRSVSRVAGETSRDDRPKTHQQRRGHHQLRPPRVGPTVARVRFS